MGNEIYINVSITDHGNGNITCEMIQSVDDGPLEATKLDRNHANKLIWELVLAGGKRRVWVNRFDRNIVVTEAYIFLDN